MSAASVAGPAPHATGAGLAHIIGEQCATLGFWGKLGVAAAIVVVQILLIWLVHLLFRKLDKRIRINEKGRIKGLVIHKITILSANHIMEAVSMAVRIAKWVVNIFQLFLTVPIVFSIFPQTEWIATTIFGYILRPLKDIGLGILHYIPNVFTIAITLAVVHYLQKTLRFFTGLLTKGKLKIHGFYPEWAMPTYNIIRVLLIAFTIAIIFPYLPGSDSKIFQGVSVLLGIIFSLGSSNAIGNLVAGIVITYMRPFKLGDFVQIQDKRGFVVQKTLMVTRIKTTKNEYITYPNITILQSSITNFETSTDEDSEGLILNAEITFNYATPWRTVHEILIQAAMQTRYVESSPAPRVLQTALDDYYARNQINCYTKHAECMPRIYSELFQNLQDGFAAHGLDMTAPQYRITLPEASRYTDGPGSAPWAKRPNDQ
jgi:small-conductance mechanosensitive channel